MSARFNISSITMAASLLLCSVAGAQDYDYFWDVAVPGQDTVFLEEMTSGQIADAIRKGWTTAIVPSGGLEQNGPYLANGKHNYAVRPMAEAVARKLGKTLVTATVKFVPEGGWEPPSGHMQVPGTISVSEATYTALLTDIARSLKTGGFTEIILMGDSGGGQQEVMAAVAEKLSARWKDDGVAVRHALDYYAKDPSSLEFLESIGVKQGDPGNIHSSYYYEAMMALADPELISASHRLANGKFSVRGYDMGSVKAVLHNAKKLVDYRSGIAVEEIEALRKASASE